MTDGSQQGPSQFLAEVAAVRAACKSDSLIEGFNLREQDLRAQDLSNLRLNKCDFTGAKLQAGKLYGTRFDGCDLVGTNLTEADLSAAKFANSCSLENATLIKAQATSAQFLGVKFKGVDATGAIFLDADFKDADLAEAHFEGADLRGAKNLRLNGTFIQSARFSPHAADRWSLLRRTYTGPRFLLNLLFPGLFIASIGAKTYGLWALALLEQAALPEGLADPCAQVSVRCESVAIWRILTGWHAGFWAGLFASMSLAYNAIRLFMTLTVAEMREEEERTGQSPPLKGKISLYPWVFRPGYHRLGIFHIFLRTFQWLTFALAVMAWWKLLATNLFIPRIG